MSNKHVDGMRLHSLSIKVSSGESEPETSQQAKHPNSQSFILLANDLKAFCLIMATSGACCNSAGTAALVSRDASLKIELLNPLVDEAAKPALFECELRDNDHRAMDLTTQHEIRTPMASILAPSQRVRFTGNICDSQQIEHLSRVMSPSLVCLAASKWALFQVLVQAKTIAEIASENDDIGFVQSLHLSIAQRSSKATFKHIPVERKFFSTTFPETTEAMSVVCA